LLRFEPQLTGHYFLEDDRGLRYADLNKAAGVRFDLVVDQRRSYFVHREDGEAQVPPGASRIGVSQLSFAHSALAMRGSLDQTFRQDLYSVTYSRGFYDGFCARTGLPPVEGEPVEFTIMGGEEEPLARRHSLLLAYEGSTALLDVPGMSHGVQLRYDYMVHPFVTLGALFEYSHTNADEGSTAFGLDHLAGLLGVAGNWRVRSDLSLRGELNLGMQAYFNSGAFKLQGQELRDNSRSTGLRLEAGLAARVHVTRLYFLEVRGGLCLEFISVEQHSNAAERYTHLAPYGAAGLGLQF
jgi:hypothetical protein